MSSFDRTLSDYSGPAQPANSLARAYPSTLFLTITNPLTILSFTLIFAGFGVSQTESYASASLLVLGVLLGSGLWWFLLSSGVGLFRSRFDTRGLKWINRGAGVIFAGFGVAILSGLLA